VASDFLFVIEVFDEPAFDRMLADLAAAVFADAGFDVATRDELSGEMRQALSAGAAWRRCRVRFEAGAGTLTVSVASDGGVEWEAKRPLSPRSPAS